MILLIDNYDSFTYNLYQYLCELGAEVGVRRNDQVTLAEVAALAPERIVISPGPCTPQEAGISVELIRAFRETDQRSDAEWCDLLRSQLAEATRIRLMSEVPLGAFLSSGVDSSSVVAMMAKASARPVVTATVVPG